MRKFVLGAIFGALGATGIGYFSGMGSYLWRVSEQSLPDVFDIVTGSITESENSTIAIRRAPRKPPDPPKEDGLFGKF